MYRPGAAAGTGERLAYRHATLHGLAIDLGGAAPRDGEVARREEVWRTDISKKTCEQGRSATTMRAPKSSWGLPCDAACGRLFHYVPTPTTTGASATTLHTRDQTGGEVVSRQLNSC